LGRKPFSRRKKNEVTGIYIDHFSLFFSSLPKVNEKHRITGYSLSEMSRPTAFEVYPVLFRAPDTAGYKHRSVSGVSGGPAPPGKIRED